MKNGQISKAKLCLVAITLLVTVVPATAGASEGQGSETASRTSSASGKKVGKPMFSTKPIPVGHGYSLTLEKFMSTIAINLSKAEGTATQFYGWAFYPMETAVTANPKMSRVSIDATFVTDAGVGASGHLKVASNKKMPGAPATMSDCPGVKFESRGGVLKGDFSFDTGTELFGKIELDSLPLKWIRRSIGRSTCQFPPWECPHVQGGFNFEAGGVQGEGTRYGTADVFRKANGATSFEGRLVQDFPGGWYSQRLTEELTPSQFDWSPDLSSATLTGGGLLGGGMTYSATQPVSNTEWCSGSAEQTHGEYSGDLSFQFDLGTVNPFANGPRFSHLTRF